MKPFPLILLCGYMCSTAIAVAEKSKRAATSEAHFRRTIERLIFPRLEFRETPFREAIDFLREEAGRLDPKARRIPFVVRLEPPAPVSVDVVPGAIDSPEALKNRADVKITVSPTNIPLFEALRYVTSLAGLKFRIGPDGIHVVPSDDPDPMFTRDFRVPADLLTALEKRDRAAKTTVAARIKKDVRSFLLDEGIIFPDGAAAILNDEGTRLTVRSTEYQFDAIEAILKSLVEGVKPVPVPGPEVPKVVWPGRADSRRIENMKRKMRRIHLAKVEFARVPLREALATLRKQGYHADTFSPKASRGVPLIFGGSEAADPLIVAVDRGPSITYSARKVSLGEALEAVTRLAGYHIDVQGYVICVQASPPPEKLLTVEFLVPPDTFPTASREAPFGQSAAPDPKEFLVSSGVIFKSAVSATFIPGRNVLIVRNTETRLREVQQWIEAQWRDYYTAQETQKKRHGRQPAHGDRGTAEGKLFKIPAA